MWRTDLSSKNIDSSLARFYMIYKESIFPSHTFPQLRFLPNINFLIFPLPVWRYFPSCMSVFCCLLFLNADHDFTSISCLRTKTSLQHPMTVIALADLFTVRLSHKDNNGHYYVELVKEMCNLHKEDERIMCAKRLYKQVMIH